MGPLIIFDDGQGQLGPLTDLRPAFDLRTGALTTLGRLERVLGAAAGLVVPPHLAALTRELHRRPVNEEIDPAGEITIVNGRCVLPPLGVESLPLGGGLSEETSGDLIAARLDRRGAESFVKGRAIDPGPALSAHAVPGGALLSRPWHLRTFRNAAIDHDLGPGLAVSPRGPGPVPPAGVTRFGGYPVTLAATARVYPTVVLDSEGGPISIGDHAVVRPGAILIGPVSIGPHSTVLDRALVKPYTAIGPHCKVAGEVGGTIFQGYANKAHDGHLGDSYVGEWSNLGAGTTNSNLLNTYGEVIARGAPGGSNERTGETFLGAIIGDHCRFAIGTRIMTGAVVHTGTMWAATAPVAGCVPPFSWVTDAGTRPFRLDKLIDIARTVMARRGITPSPAYLQRLAALRAAAVRDEPRTE